MQFLFTTSHAYYHTQSARRRSAHTRVLFAELQICKTRGVAMGDQVKVILLGDSGVGKTSLVHCYVNGGSGNPNSSVSVRSSQYDPDVQAKEVNIGGKTVKVKPMERERAR